MATLRDACGTEEIILQEMIRERKRKGFMHACAELCSLISLYSMVTMENDNISYTYKLRIDLKFLHFKKSM